MNYHNVFRLVAAYRKYGHLKATINPVALSRVEHVPQLNPSHYLLKPNQNVSYKGIIASNEKSEGTVEEAIKFLEKTYCQSIGYEISYLPTEEFEWLIKKIETMKPLSSEKKIILMEDLLKSQVFDQFLAIKFSTLKRYGGEGAESMISAFYQIIDFCHRNGISDVVLGMPHRGRLNLLTGLLQQPPALVFRYLKKLNELQKNI